MMHRDREFNTFRSILLDMKSEETEEDKQKIFTEGITGTLVYVLSFSDIPSYRLPSATICRGDGQPH